MTNRLNSRVLKTRGEIVSPPQPSAARACTDQTFELPGGIYVAMALMFTGFVAVLGLSLREHLSVSLGVIFFFIGAFFAIPAIFTRTKVERTGAKSLSFFDFAHRGIATATGRVPAGEATILVLLLPFVILCWGIAISVIAALV